MSQQSLNIQEISSRTFNNDYSMMQTSIEPIEKSSPYQIMKGEQRTKKNQLEEICRLQQREIEQYKKTLMDYVNRFQGMDKSKLYKESYEVQIKESLEALQEKERKYRELEERYKEAISGLSETIEKNRMLSSEVARLSRKLQESDLNYSREQQTIHRSQQVLSNMAIAKSSYEIQLVNMQDSLVILQLEKKEIEKTNEEYEDKLALIAQEVERLRNQLDHSRRENEQLKKKVVEQADILLKFDLENKELRGSMERMRMESRELRVVNDNQTLQLKEYYEKVVYKETIISDYQERQAKITSLLRDRETQLGEMDIKFKQTTHRLEEESGNRKAESTNNRQLTKEINRLRSILNESSESTRLIQRDRQQIIKENETLSKHLQSMGGELQTTIKERDSLMRDHQALLLKLQNASKQIDLLAKERDSLVREREKLLVNLQQYNQSLNKMIDQRGKETDGSKRAIEERTQQLINEFNSKMEVFSQQRQAEITAKMAEIEQLKKELIAKHHECNEYRSELTTRNSQLNQARQEKLSQSSIFDSSRRDLQQKLKEKNDIISELKAKTSNLQKLIEQNRRQRDLIFEEKNSVVIQTHKTEQLIELKNSDLRNREIKIEDQARRIKEMQGYAEECGKEIENYKRVVADCEQHIRELTQQVQRGNSINAEMQKLSQLLREKEGQINELNVRLRQTTHVMEQKKTQLTNLRANNQKMSMSLSRVQQSKNNFQLFLKEIDRLNHLVTRKQTQITTLKHQLSHLIAKIDSLAQQQLKIVKILEGSLVHDERREDQLNHYFLDLKQYLHSLSSETNSHLRELTQQNVQVSDGVARSEEKWQEIGEKLEAAHVELGRKEKEIGVLTQQYNSAVVKLQEYEQSNVQQQEVFEKLLELTRENAGLRQQITHQQYSQQTRDNSLSVLDAKIKQAEQQLQLARRQISEVKTEWGRERQHLFNQLKDREQSLKEAKLIREQLQRKVATVSEVIDRKVKDFESMATIIASNTKEMDRYRQIIRIYEQRQPGQADSKAVEGYLTQIDKLKQILQIRTAQQTMNQDNFKSLTLKLQKAEKEVSRYKNEQHAFQQVQEKCLEFEYQIKQLQQDRHELELKNSQSESIIAEITNQQRHQQSQRASQDLSVLKSHIQQLQTELSTLYGRIRQGENKLLRADRQIQQLQGELQGVLQANAHAIDQLQLLEAVEMEKQQLQQNYSAIEDELENARGMARQMEIENRYMRGSQEHSKIFLHSYEYKTAELEKEYTKLKQVINSISLENSKLQTKNHFFEIELNKADILQQKIQVLNAEINRLARENIDLNEEITTCKMALSGENSLERRAEEQLVVSVLLMAEVQSLRNRVKQQEEELKRSHLQQLSKYRS